MIPYVTDGHIFGKLVFLSKVTCGKIFLRSNLEGSRPVDLYLSVIKHVATISFLTARDTVLIYMQQFLSCRPFHPQPGEVTRNMQQFTRKEGLNGVVSFTANGNILAVFNR